MKQFLAIYIGTAAARERSKWESLGEATRKEKEKAGIAAWGAWMQQHAKSVVVTGGPLGKTKRTAADGISDIKNGMAGYVVVQAESQQSPKRSHQRQP